jgi:glycosyltransferase involved in cell wall biosynthesis
VSRLLVCGLAPLPGENTLKNYGPGIRTWQLARGLAGAGHEVRLLAMRIADAYREGEGRPAEERDGVSVERLSAAELLESERVRETIGAFAPDAVVGATIYGSYALARCRPVVPFWADQFGHVMAEGQAKAAVDRNDAVVPYFWQLVRTTMTWADKVSVVSERQRYAAVGELGALGRLNAGTCGYEFTAVIPCPSLGEGGSPAPAEFPERPEREAGAPFTVLWSGSYNTWCDVETLYAALEIAMSANPRIRFLSTGGPVPGHDDSTYETFQRLVAGSRFAERFRLDGWLEAGQVRARWDEADLGVLTEKPIYEGVLGSKNRIVQWLAAGLPVAYNRVGDLGDLLASERLGLTFPTADAPELARAILFAADHPSEMREMARRARARVAEWSIESTTRTLSEWARAPRLAPDSPLKEKLLEPPGHVSLLRASALTTLKRLPGVGHLRWARSAWRGLRSIRRGR